MILANVWLLFRRELRSALRERSIVVNSILVPLLVYPLMLWLIVSGLGFVQGQEEKDVSRIAVGALPAAHAELLDRLAEVETIEIIDAAEDAALRSADADLRVEVVQQPPALDGLADNFVVRLHLDGSRSRSEIAARRFEAVLDDYRAAWLEREGRRLGLGDAELVQARLSMHDLATGRELGSFLLGLMVPLLMVVMIAVGCFVPAIDSTAGERERRTWETTMTLGVARLEVVLAKFLYVAALGTAAGLLNLFAFAISMRVVLTPLAGAGGLEISVPPAAWPLLVLAATLLALFLAAGMMLFASFARSFKEGQAMVGPFQIVAILPPLMVNQPDLELTLGWALVPVANMTLFFRGAITESLAVGPAMLAVVVQLVGIAALIAAARWILSFEDVLIGSYDGSLLKWLKERRASGAAGGS
ncbi:MAG: ABC transporter permease subunit [Acidobacteriota bacterium]